MEWPVQNGSVVLQNALLHETGVHKLRNQKLGMVSAVSILLLIAGWRSLSFVQTASHLISWLPVFIFGLLLLISLVIAYRLLFKRSWAASVKVQELISVDVEEEADAVSVKMNLASGRYKTVRFATRAAAYEMVRELREENHGLAVHYS